MPRKKKSEAVTGQDEGSPRGQATKKPELNPTDPASDIKVDEPQRSDEDVEWSGGLPIDLSRIMADGKTLRQTLEIEVGDWLKQELRNQEERIESIKKWEKQYSGKRPPKSYPYIGVNNLATPMTRVNVDAVMVRVFDAVFGQKKVFICTAKKPEYVETAPQVEDLLDWWQKNIANLKTRLFSPIMQAVKSGTGIVYLSYSRKRRTVFRYAKPEEVQNQGILGDYVKFFNVGRGQKAVKVPVTTYEGPDLRPISREDFVISSDADCIEDAFLVGFRTYLREPEIKVRIKQGFYEKEVFSKLQSGQFDETKEERAKIQGKEIGSEKKPYEIWQLWLKYDVDEDGEEDDIVITIEPKKNVILRAIYNPFFNGFRPFIAFTGYPKEYCFDGEGLCEILQDLQEAKDTIHNQRLDRMDQINGTSFIIKSNSGLDKFKLAPGTTWVTDDDPSTVINELRFGEVYPSTWNEEAMIEKAGGEAVGVTQNVLGQSTSERPVAKETMAVLQEANKKFKFLIDNIRDRFAELGHMVIDMFAQYQPTYSYFDPQKGMQDEQSIQFPFDYIRDGMKIELTASSEMLNQEVRRDIDLTVYQILSDYYTKLASMVQAVESPALASGFKEFIIKSSMIGAEVLRRLLADFNITDNEQLVLDIPTGVGQQLQQAMAMSVDLMPPPQQPPGGSGAKPGGNGGEQPPQGQPTPQGQPQGPPSAAGPQGMM